MGLRACLRRRRVAATLALLGMAFYAMLFPWHTVSQTALQLGQAQLGLAAMPPCHEGSATDQTAPSKDSKPAKPRSHCPICSGFASLQITLAGAAGFLISAPEVGGRVSFATIRHVAEAAPRIPQSRGPPSFPA
jgi:Protein of unknown function (DUF2946)